MDVVMRMYIFKKYKDNYSKTSGIFWQHCRDEPTLANDGNITDFNEGNALIILDKIFGTKCGNPIKLDRK